MAYRDYSTEYGRIVAQDGTGDFLTITAAIASVPFGHGATIFIKPSSNPYNESFSITQPINLCSFECNGTLRSNSYTVNINGTVTIDAHCAFSGIVFNQVDQDLFSVVINGSTASVVSFIDCSFELGSGISYTNSSSFGSSNFINCGFSATGNNGFFQCTSPGAVNFYNCNYINQLGGTPVASIFNTTVLNMFGTIFQDPIALTATTATINNSVLGLDASNSTCITTVTSGTCTIENSSLDSGSASAISIGAGTSVLISHDTITSSNTDAITGSGSVTVGDIVWGGSSSTINASTIVAYIEQHGTINVVNPLTVPNGGTGNQSSTAYGLITGGTTSTSALQNAGTGTLGEVYTSGGAASLGTWQLPSSIGGLVLLQTQTASNSANLTFTTGISSAYSAYLFIFNGIVPVSSSNLQMAVSTNGGASYVNSGYTTGYNISTYNSAVFFNANDTTVMMFTGGITSGSLGVSGKLEMFNIGAGLNPMCTWQTNEYVSGSRISIGSGSNNTITGVNAFQFICNGSNIASGTISLYGYAQ